MDKHSPTRVVGRIWPYALLLGSLALPATVISQTNNTTGNAEFTPPVQQPPMGYEARDYTGMAPAWGSQNNRVGAGTAPMPSPMGGGTMGEAMGRAMDGFMGQMQQQPSGYPQNYGPGGYGPYGASPFDSVTAPSQRPSAEYATGGSGYGSAPAPSAPSSPFDMGSTPFSSSQQGTPSDRRTMARRNAAMPPTMGQGMFSQGPRSGMMGDSYCAHKPLMGHHGNGMGHGNMRSGADISQLLRIPELSDEQREKIYSTLDGLRRNHWELLGEKLDHSAELRNLYKAEQLDAKAIGAAYGKIFDVKQKMIESGIEAKQKARDVLTDEQKEQLRVWEKSGY